MVERLGRAGFFRTLDTTLVVDQLEGILVNLSRGQHLGHTLDQVRNVGPARFLAGLVFPEGHRRGLAARAVHSPVSVVEPRPHSDARNGYFLEASDAFLHLLWLNLDSHYPDEHGTSPSFRSLFPHAWLYWPG